MSCVGVPALELSSSAARGQASFRAKAVGAKASAVRPGPAQLLAVSCFAEASGLSGRSFAASSQRRAARSSRDVAAKASPVAAIDSFTEELIGEEWEEIPVHSVTVHDRKAGKTYTFDVPQDQYILQTGEEHGINLPFACRHGCCTACAVRIKSGELLQPQALGISQELKAEGYALLCVGVPTSDLEVETQDEDEVYYKQFGRYFARGPVDRDDYALELAMQDE